MKRELINEVKPAFRSRSGIGLIPGRLKNVRECGGNIIIKNCRSNIAAVIRLSGLAELLVEGIKP
ncbi:MAG: hypothetical protein ACI4KM_06935 [Oscillospiraceae bacterium]